MNAARLLDLYDRVADAPDAIDRLRRFVIDLAVRGKLVEQDPTDEPASELLKRIAVEKAHMVKAGKIRKPRTLGGHRSRHIERGSRDLSPRGLQSSSATLMPAGTVLFSSRAPIGYVAIAANAVSTNQGFKSIVPYVSDCSAYIALAMQAFAPGMENSASGTTFKEVSGRIVAGVPFPLPPLAEQHRIVAKVDELFALCDRLEETRIAREDARDRLTRASLARVSAADTDAAAFRGYARFAIHALPALTARPDQVRHLRQTILSLAVRGKLVEQNPANEPASQLLEQIAVKKARLLKARKIRKRKPREPLSPPESAFGLPSGWTAARLSDVVVELQTGPFGSSLHKSDYEMGGTPVVNPASIRNGRIVPVAKMAVGTDTLERLAHFKLRAGDIVMGRRGEMGRCAVVAEDEDGWLCGTGSLILRLPDSVCADYLATLIGSPDVREYLQGSSVGTTMRNLNQSILLAMSIGLPPLAEQHRIVAKVDALMALCDQLEAEAGYADRIRSRLLDSLLHESLASQEASINGTVGGGARVWT